MDFFKLAKSSLPSLMPITMDAKLSSSSTMSAAVLFSGNHVDVRRMEGNEGWVWCGVVLCSVVWCDRIYDWMYKQRGYEGLQITSLWSMTIIMQHAHSSAHSKVPYDAITQRSTVHCRAQHINNMLSLSVTFSSHITAVESHCHSNGYNDNWVARKE